LKLDPDHQQVSLGLSSPSRRDVGVHVSLSVLGAVGWLGPSHKRGEAPTACQCMTRMEDFSRSLVAASIRALMRQGSGKDTETDKKPHRIRETQGDRSRNLTDSGRCASETRWQENAGRVPTRSGAPHSTGQTGPGTGGGSHGGRRRRGRRGASGPRRGPRLRRRRARARRLAPSPLPRRAGGRGRRAPVSIGWGGTLASDCGVLRKCDMKRAFNEVMCSIG
jgi:hypothetical protein